MARAYEEDPHAAQEIARLSGRTVETVAKALVPDAQRYAPVDTGKLKAHIDAHKVTETHWRVVANTEYAAAVEEGHTTRSGSHVPAQPYLRPAAYKNRTGDM
jgi:hypothetical protein